MSAPADFETVAWVYDPSDLALLLSLFESEDIFVLPIGRWHASVDLPLTTALGGVELRVHAGDAADARLLLASLPPVHRESFPVALLVLLLLLTLLLGLAAPPSRQVPSFVLRGTVAAPREPIAA